MEPTNTTSRSYDVVIIGGSLSGAATAILLLREQPKLRVLIVEKSTSFGRRVGEATVEVSCFFLGRVLGLTQHLNEAHLVKQGMRFWFSNDKTISLADCSEVGGRYLARVPSYQVDRAVLDEEVLRRAVVLGAELWRDGRVRRVELKAGGEQVLHLDFQSREVVVRTRWVVDASGVAALLARQEGWWRPNTALPTAACWARWTGVKDWDGLELAQKFPEWFAACRGIRGTATNHLTGDGWWAWWIPLKGGDISIGVVFDQRRVTFPEGGTLGDRLKTFLERHPVAKEMLADARWREGDVHWRKNLPYFSTTFAGNGFALIGDAAGFLDPLYSPGMDWIAYTVTAATQLILKQQNGNDITEPVTEHNRKFSLSYARWFGALYQYKYDFLADYDLMRVAFALDVGLYYMGVVSQPFKNGGAALSSPTFSHPLSVPFFKLIRFYNRRLSRIAAARRRRGMLGQNNMGKRFLIGGFMFEPREGTSWIVKSLARWGWLELREGWRSWGRAESMPTTATPTAFAGIAHG